jgi:23S rRNA (guanine745-N1)-methyltransferase
MKTIYQCPVCQLPLQKDEKRFVCSQGHSFDIARDGSVNLLLANQKKTKDPGDNKFMIENRGYFLEQGYYDFLSDAVNELVGNASCILDLGCGEGFYSDRLLKFLGASTGDDCAAQDTQIFGIDISKSAIQKAAKRSSNINGGARIEWCVGSTFHLPYSDVSFDGVFSLFAPFEKAELARVLSPGGRFICVRPGAGHLKELAAILYPQAQLQGNPLDMFSDPGFSLIEKRVLSYEIELKSSRDILSLVSMTPYYWHMDQEKEQLLRGKERYSVSLAFEVSVFRKH